MDSSLNWEPVVLYPQNNPLFTGYVYGITNINNKSSLAITESSDGFNTNTADIKIVY